MLDRSTIVPNRLAAGTRCLDRLVVFHFPAVGDSSSTISGRPIVARLSPIVSQLGRGVLIGSSSFTSPQLGTAALRSQAVRSWPAYSQSFRSWDAVSRSRCLFSLPRSWGQQLYDLRPSDRSMIVPNRLAAGTRCLERLVVFHFPAVGDNSSTISGRPIVARLSPIVWQLGRGFPIALSVFASPQLGTAALRSQAVRS